MGNFIDLRDIPVRRFSDREPRHTVRYKEFRIHSGKLPNQEYKSERVCHGRNNELKKKGLLVCESPPVISRMDEHRDPRGDGDNNPDVRSKRPPAMRQSDRFRQLQQNLKNQRVRNHDNQKSERA
jgi:hypothetical protein